MNKRLHELVAPVLNKIHAMQGGRDGPVLVAIDGRSGVGKSLLAEIIKNRTDGALVSGDDFYGGGITIHRQLSPDQLADICIDRARFRTVLEALKSGGSARFHPFDWTAFDGRLSDQEKIAEPNAVLIAEGVYTFHPELRDLVDLSVLIECPEQTRLQRLVSREGKLSEWEQQWRRAEDWYFNDLSPPSDFDLRINNV